MTEARISCMSCGAPNGASRRYCRQCGARLGSSEVPEGSCGRCGSGLAPGDSYCGVCGLGAGRAASLGREVERRQLTVMFCDLADSTRMSGKLDPEDLREINRAYQQSTSQAIEKYGGFVARYMGDGVLAYFGYPQAHGDDPTRAVLAGLAAVAAIQRLSGEVGAPRGVEMRIRVGIATGLVVVGDLIGEGVASERAVVGETPNLAARLQGAAPLDGVVVAPETRRRLGASFRVQSRGKHRFKGFEDEVEVWQVLEPLDADRVDVGRSRLVGRAAELETLHAAWEEARGGSGRRVLISGEAGVGKSRLVEAFVEGLASGSARTVELRASDFQQLTALHPVRQWIVEAAGLAGVEDPASRGARLREFLGGCGTDDTGVALLAHTLDLGTDHAPPTGDPRTLSELTLDTLAGVLTSLSRVEPLAVVFTDAQWADSATHALLARIHEDAGAPILELRTSRASPGPELDDDRTSRIHLGGVSREAALEIVAGVTGGRPLPDALFSRIMAQTAGVPLFIEELVAALLEQGLLIDKGGVLTTSGSVPALAVPTTLQDSIMARLDRLGHDKTVAQIASVIGREVSCRLLAVVSGLSEAELAPSIDKLVGAGVLAPAVDGVVSFRQGLVQETAYESLLRSRRRQLHAEVARALPEVLPDVAEQHPERLAHHHAEAGDVRAAVAGWRAAAERALARFAVEESVAHLRHARDALRGEGVTGDNADDQLGVLLRLAELARVVDRQQRALDALEEAEAVARAWDRVTRLSEIHFMRGNVLFLKGDVEGCLAQHELARARAAEAGSPELEARALGGLGDAYYTRGHMRTAHEHFRRCVELAHQHGFDQIEAANRHMIGWTLLFLARIEEAVAVAREGAAFAVRVGHVRAEMVAAGAVAFGLGELAAGEALLEPALRSVELADRLGSSSFGAAARSYLARGYLSLGRAEDARRVIAEALAAVRSNPDVASFVGPSVLGALVQVSGDEETRQAAIAEGDALLARGSVGHNHLWFHAHVMESAVVHGEWDEAERRAGLLERYTAEEPQPWCDVQIAWMRALARASREGVTDEVRAALEDVRARLDEAGIRRLLPRVDGVLGGAG